MKRVDEFTGLVEDYDSTTDVDEWIVCSRGQASALAHSCHTDFRYAKLAQIKLALEGIDAWIEHISPFGPPTTEQQLDAEIYLNKEQRHDA